MTRMKLSENYRSQKKNTRVQIPNKSNDNNNQVIVVSEFVRAFVRRHVTETQRTQSDLCWRPGSNISHNINLLPQSTKIHRQLKRSRRITTTLTNNDSSLIVKKRKSKSFTKSLLIEKPSVIASDLPIKLHSLWNGYFQSVMSMLLNKLNNNNNASINFNMTKNLDTVLRLNLIGAQLKILRSTSCRVLKVL
ncbi:unnamed protein product [Schistosoma turkestanicum]|nr:unnamed protein product [Schistosoma turkestanicum]